MHKRFAFSLLLLFISFVPYTCFAWGKDGHQIVGNLAEHFLSDSTRQKVQKYLGKTSFAYAATWMDESRSNDYYGYMRTWHYIDFDKGEEYKPVAERNALTVLHAAIKDLQHKKDFKNSAIREKLYMIFHLVGDLHQPLHVGYSNDRGGNSVQVSYIFKSYNSNLHSVWDTEIIQSEKINVDSCLKVYATFTADEVKNYKKINEIQWMKESRSLLDTVYNFDQDKGLLDKTYVLNNKSIVTRQLVLSGLRLAAVLEELFKS